MRLESAWQLEGEGGTRQFTGNSSVLLDPSNIVRVADQDNSFFFGQITNMSEKALRVSLFMSKNNAQINNHDLGGGEALKLRGVPLYKMGVVVSGTVSIRAIGIIVKCTDPKEIMRMISDTIYEFDQAIRPQLANEQYFLQKKNEDSKLIQIQGAITGTGVICSYTPASGITFTICESRINSQVAGVYDAFTQRLLMSNVIKTQNTCGLNTNMMSDDFHFIPKGERVIGNGVLNAKLDCVAVAAGNRNRGSIRGYIS